MNIVDLATGQSAHIEQVAAILVKAFAHFPDTWATLKETRAEALESF